MRGRIAPVLILVLACAGTARSAAAASATDDTSNAALSPQAAARFAGLALKCLHQEYPNHMSLSLESAADARPPHELTPAFYGCLDWHSDVHGHWLLVRLLRLMPRAPFAAQARAELARSFTPENIAGEVRYLNGPGRSSFERPYGLAWLLRLAQELHASTDPDMQRWAQTLEPLEKEAAAHLVSWLPKLHYPIRVGEHDQTAFSFGLMWDWAGSPPQAGTAALHAQMLTLLKDAAQRFYLHDRSCPLGYEPSGEDFLSPCLAEADFMRRVLAPPAFASWLSQFLPQIPHGGAAGGSPWLAPAVITDRADPKLAHLDGLNLSRAWMLEGIASALPPADARVAVLRASAREHAAESLPAVTGEHYEGGHWLGTYAVYLTSRAGIAH
jgi:Protein of unknown function (DUF2891)